MDVRTFYKIESFSAGIDFIRPNMMSTDNQSINQSINETSIAPISLADRAQRRTNP